MAEFRDKSNWIVSTAIIQTLMSIGDDEDFVLITKAYFNYLLTGEQNALPNELGLFFNFLVADTDLKEKTYTAVCEARSEAGRKGANARWNKKSKDGE